MVLGLGVMTPRHLIYKPVPWEKLFFHDMHLFDIIYIRNMNMKMDFVCYFLKTLLQVVFTEATFKCRVYLEEGETKHSPQSQKVAVSFSLEQINYKTWSKV